MNLLGIFGGGNPDVEVKEEESSVDDSSETLQRMAEDNESISKCDQVQHSEGLSAHHNPETLTQASRDAEEKPAFDLKPSDSHPESSVSVDLLGPEETLESPSITSAPSKHKDVENFGSDNDLRGTNQDPIAATTEDNPTSTSKVDQELASSVPPYEPAGHMCSQSSSQSTGPETTTRLTDRLEAIHLESYSRPVSEESGPSSPTLPAATTYADALDLATRYPGLSEHFLSASLASSSPAKNKIPVEPVVTEDHQDVERQSSNEGAVDKPLVKDGTIPGVTHTPDRPNWAAAPDKPTNNEKTKPLKSRNDNRRARGRATPNRRGRHGARKQPEPPIPSRQAESPSSQRSATQIGAGHQTQTRGRRGSRIVPNRVFSQSTRPLPISTPPRSQHPSPGRTPSPGRAAHSHVVESHSLFASSAPRTTQRTSETHNRRNDDRMSYSPAHRLNEQAETLLHSRLATQLSQQTANMNIPGRHRQRMNQQNDVHMNNIWIQYLNSVAHLYHPQTGNVARSFPAGAELPSGPNAPHGQVGLAPQFHSGFHVPLNPPPITANRYPNSALRQNRAPVDRLGRSSSRNSSSSPQSQHLPAAGNLLSQNGGCDPSGAITSLPRHLAIDRERPQDLDSTSFNWRRATVVPQPIKDLSPMSSQQGFGTEYRSNEIVSNSYLNQEGYMAAPQSRGRLDHSKGITPLSQGYRAISHTQRHS